MPTVVTRAAEASPFAPADFARCRITDAWREYGDRLAWGRGQTLAALDDGFDTSGPEYAAVLPWGPKVAATFNAFTGGADVAPVPPAYHGTTVTYPSSLNCDGRCGVAFNNQLALVRCVSVVHLPEPGIAQAPTMAAGLQWVIDHRRELNITAVNFAMLDDRPRTEPIATAIDEKLARLRELGVWVSAPCGNNEFTTGISWPACQDRCYAIGATKDDGGPEVVHRDRWENTELLVPAAATSSSNAMACGAFMAVREAIEKAGYDWRADGPNLPDAVMAIFRRTGAMVHDPATGLSFPRLDLRAALDQVFRR